MPYRRHPSPVATPRAGMTLIEIMIAVTVLATGLFAGIGAIGNAHFTSARRMNVDRAMSEIQNQIEILQAEDDQSLQARFAGGDVLFFPISGLGPTVNPALGPGRMSMPGMIERVQVVNGSLRRTSLRVAAFWEDQTGQASVEQFFHFTDRR